MLHGRYDSKTDTWTIVAPINSPRDAVGVCVLGDKLYAVGGYDGSMYRHDVEAYDPQTNEWTKVSYVTFTVQWHQKVTFCSVHCHPGVTFILDF